MRYNNLPVQILGLLAIIFLITRNCKQIPHDKEKCNHEKHTHSEREFTNNSTMIDENN